MYHNIKQANLQNLLNSKIVYALLYSLTFIYAFNINLAEAAKDGNLNSRSTGSVNISITVNQSLKTVSPTELLLNDKPHTKNNSNNAFCVAHHGFSQEASVPYKLHVDEIKSFTQMANTSSDQPLPFDIILNDKQLIDSKQKLLNGMTFEKQSSLNINKQLRSECASAGLAISIEKNTDNNKKHEQINSALLFLLVSPE